MSNIPQFEQEELELSSMCLSDRSGGEAVNLL